MKDGRASVQTARRWRRALDRYAQGVARELTAFGIDVLDWFVDVRGTPFWVDFAVVDSRGYLVEFHFCDDLGWLQTQGTRCGRLTAGASGDGGECAEDIALPPRHVAVEILRALTGEDWPTCQSPVASARHVDPNYLASLLAVLEEGAPRAAP